MKYDLKNVKRTTICDTVPDQASPYYCVYIYIKPKSNGRGQKQMAHRLQAIVAWQLECRPQPSPCASCTSLLSTSVCQATAGWTASMWQSVVTGTSWPPSGTGVGEVSLHTERFKLVGNFEYERLESPLKSFLFLLLLFVLFFCLFLNINIIFCCPQKLDGSLEVDP